MVQSIGIASCQIRILDISNDFVDDRYLLVIECTQESTRVYNHLNTAFNLIFGFNNLFF